MIVNMETCNIGQSIHEVAREKTACRYVVQDSLASYTRRIADRLTQRLQQLGGVRLRDHLRVQSQRRMKTVEAGKTILKVAREETDLSKSTASC